jgi:hypothetical protein
MKLSYFIDAKYTISFFNSSPGNFSIGAELGNVIIK